MSKSDLILHVGLPKTASTALQRLFYENRGLLNDYGLVYPEVNTDTISPKHHYLFAELVKADFPTLCGMLQTNKGKNILLSAEAMTNHFYDFSDNALSSFREVTNNYNVRVLLCVRDPMRWSKSYYCQAIINPEVRLLDYYATSLTLGAFRGVPRVAKLMNFQKLATDVGEGYGADSVDVIKVGGDWMAQLAKVINAPGLKTLEPDRTNESPPTWAIELLRQVNAYRLPEERRMAWKASICVATGTTHTLLKRAFALLSPEDAWLELDILNSLYPRDDPDFPMTASDIDEFKCAVSKCQPPQLRSSDN